MVDDLSDVNLYLIESVEDAMEFKRWLGGRRDVLAFDTETHGLDWWRHPTRLIQIGDAHTGWAMDAVRWNGVANEALTTYDGELVATNTKFDVHMLEEAGISVPTRKIHDTVVMSKLANPGQPAGLKPLAARLVNPRATAGEQLLKSAMRENGWTWGTVPIDFPPYWQYGALDTVLSSRVWAKLKPDVTPLLDVYETEMACLMLLQRMERKGVMLDFGYITEMIAKLEPWVAEMKAWIKAEFGIENPNANDPCIRYLQDLGFRWPHRTEKGNIALTGEVLRGIDHPFAKALLDFREWDRVLGTYLKNYVEYAHGDLLHASTNINGAKTGRMSIGRPSLQNIPRNEHPRNAFIARPGNRLVLCDYDQIEMRLMAHFSGSTKMIEAIRYGDEMTAAGHPGYDVHSMNARGVYGIDFDEPVPKQKRQITKNSGFAKIFGAGLEQFAHTAQVTVEEARAFLETYDREFPEVTQMQERIQQEAFLSYRDTGDAAVTAPDGRRHVAPKREVYKLVNYLIQGTAASVLKRKMVELDNNGLGDYLVLPVHDELIADVPEDEVDEYGAEMKRVMTDNTTFSVPLTVDHEVVECWGEKYREAS